MRIVGSILATGALAFVGFFSLIFLALSGEVLFYPYFIPIMFGLLILFSNLAIWGQWKKKWFIWSLVSFLVISFLSVTGFEVNENRLEASKIMSKQDVNLSEYEPFQASSKAVKLKETSSFTITDNIPRLDGSTALYPVYAGFVQAVYPKRDYNPYDYDKSSESGQVVSTQTAHAFERLLAGNTDIIFVPKPSNKYMELAKEKGKELKLTPIGKEAFVFFVHAENPIHSLTVEQIQGIYSGKLKSWKELGGSNDVVEAYQRPEESGSQQALIRFMGDQPIMKPETEKVAAGMGGIMNQVAEYQNKKNAIGFSFRYFSEEMVQNGKIRNLAVNGIQPTKQSIRDGSYPITVEIYAVTAGTTNPNVEPFIQWILSEQGQRIIEETGYVGVK
jgi:phosphate transport system substrate-binding protein